jgi:hypothetical protein
LRAAIALAIVLSIAPPSLPTTFAQQSSHANNIVGINVARLTHDRYVAAAGDLVNSNGGEWGWLTLTWTREDRDIGHSEWLRDQLIDRCFQFRLHPIVRISTHYDEGSGIWDRPTDDEPAKWRRFLEGGKWPSDVVYVIVGNEPNLGFEWGGEVDSASYARYLARFIDEFKNSPRFRIVNAPMDASNHTEMPKMQDAIEFMHGMRAAVPDIFDRLSAWASNPYRVPSGGDGIRFTHLAYRAELEAIGKQMPVLITESGLMETGSDAHTAEYFEQAYIDWAKDPLVVAATPLFWDPHKHDFWMFNPGIDGSVTKPSLTYERIFALPKRAGSPSFQHPLSVPGTPRPPVDGATWPTVSQSPPQPASEAMLVSPATSSAGPAVFAPWKVTPPFGANPLTFQAATEGTRSLRALPSPDAPTVVDLDDDSQLTWAGGEARVDGQLWRLVRTESGAEGWIVADSLRPADAD